MPSLSMAPDTAFRKLRTRTLSFLGCRGDLLCIFLYGLPMCSRGRNRSNKGLLSILAISPNGKEKYDHNFRNTLPSLTTLRKRGELQQSDYCVFIEELSAIIALSR